jgi:hypothetical protein
MKNILITGGKGLIGSYLKKKFIKAGYSIKVLTRTKQYYNDYIWNIEANFIDIKALHNIDIIIHLAGTSITQYIWNRCTKKKILQSRIKGLYLLYKYIIEYKIKIQLLITICGVNNCNTNDSFIKNINNAIIDSANIFKKINTRVVNIQTGIVLCKNSLIIKKPLFYMNKYHVGCYFGNNENYIPWIHVHDLYRYYLYIINNNILGVVKTISTDKISIKNLIYSLARNKKIFLCKIPIIFMYMIYGQMIQILLYKYRIPDFTILKLKYSKLNQAINNIINN